MANNTVLNAGSGGDTIQTVDNTTYKTPVTVLANSTGANFASVNTTNELLIRENNQTATGSLGAANALLDFSGALNSAGTVGIAISGTWVGTISFYGSVEDTNYFAINAIPISGGALVTSTTANGQWQVDCSGFKDVQVKMTAYTSGSATVTLVSSDSASLLSLDGPLPTGSNIIGKVGIDQTTVGTTNGVSLAQIGATTVVTGGVNGTLAVGGVTAVNATSTGNPVYTGGIAVVGANPTKATNGQRSGVATDAAGRLITVQNHERTMTGVQQTTITSSTAETTIVTAVASTFCDITHLSITNGSGTPTIVTLKDSTAGTTRGIWNCGAGSGVILSFPTPLSQATVNNNWTITCGTSVASVYVVAQFIKNT